MTTEQQQIAIAQACGWSDIKKGPYDVQPFGRHKTHELLPLPDYLNDLNAMHEAEKSLNPVQLEIYQEYLARIVFHKDGFESAFSLPSMKLLEACHATASQRAEAFLRALNLYVP